MYIDTKALGAGLADDSASLSIESVIAGCSSNPKHMETDVHNTIPKLHARLAVHMLINRTDYSVLVYVQHSR